MIFNSWFVAVGLLSALMIASLIAASPEETVVPKSAARLLARS
jgi:hypothetical protein